MKPEEAIERAAAEGLTLVRSSDNQSGFVGVYLSRSRYEAQVKRGGALQHLGTFGTAEEAALAYARALGPEGSAAAAAKWDREAPMTPEEAIERAAAEGLTLVRSSIDQSGFAGVYRYDSRIDTTAARNGSRWQPRLRHGGSQRSLGTFGTAEEAALAYARSLGPEGSAAAAAVGAREAREASMTAKEAIACAAAEGLTLVRSSGQSGFAGVNIVGSNRTRSGWQARHWRDGAQQHLGTFGTAEQAALAYARALGPEGSAAAAAKEALLMVERAASEGLTG